jgi:hypothetical protein
MTDTFLIQNGDIQIDATSGRPVMIADGPKLGQDLGEDLAVSVRDNGFGAGLDGLIGKLGDEFSLRAEVGRRVRRSIESMQSLQNRFHKTQRPKAEKILRLNSVTTSMVADKKTTLVFLVSVTSGNGSTVTTTVGLG